MIYLLWGADEFGIELAVSKLTGGDGQILNLKEVGLEQFGGNALTDSFFDTQKTLIVNTLLERAAKEKREDELARILDNISDQTTVIFVEKVAPKGKLKKFFEERAQIKSFGKPSSKELSEHVKGRAKELGTEIAPLAAERFVTYIGPNFWQLEEELKKLALYVKNRDLEPNIDINDVDELVHAGFEANIFELMDAISQKNTNRAITLLDSFLDSGENEIYILTMIARQFRNIAMAKIDNIQSETALAKKAGVHPFVAKKSILQARNFTNGEIEEIFRKIVRADQELKSGQNPKQALQSIIIN